MDIAEFNDSWRGLWRDAPPAARRLWRLFPERSVRFHTLPDAKRYATSEAEKSEILRRHHTLLDVLFRNSAENSQKLKVITCSWSLSAEPTPRDQMVADITPGAVHWRSDNLARKPEYNGWQHHYVSELAVDSPVLTLLLRYVANDITDGVILTNTACTWVYHPYDGGMDVFARSTEDRDRLSTAYADWLPQAA